MTDTHYHALREQVEGLLTEARHDRALVDEAGKLRTYWHIGDALFRHVDGLDNPAHGDSIVANLSKDVHLGLATLYDILRYRRLLPSFYSRRNLQWTHYRALLRLPDAEQFAYYEQLADEGAWTTRQLKQAIDADKGGQVIQAEQQPKALRAQFGQLNTFRVIEDPLGGLGVPALDLGFHQIWAPRNLPGLADAQPGDRATLHTSPQGELSVRRRHDNPGLWTYVAQVRRIIDGDTLIVAADLGADHRATPRLRLRGIDTSELYTQAGQQARTFVANTLQPVSFVVIATRRTDTYGRYLADVKYLPGESDPRVVLKKGVYLNRQLLDEGLAVRYEG